MMEINIAQYSTGVDHDPLFMVFLEIRKAYNTVDR